MFVTDTPDGIRVQSIPVVKCEVLDEARKFVAELKERKSGTINGIPKFEQVVTKSYTNIFRRETLPPQTGF